MRFIQPENVISTVPISSGNQNTQSVPRNWLTAAPKPMTTSQRTVTSYMRVCKNALPVISDKLSDKAITQSSASKELLRDDAASYDSMETDYMP